VVIDQALDSLVVVILVIFLWALLSEGDAVRFKLMLVYDSLPGRFLDDERSVQGVAGIDRR